MLSTSIGTLSDLAATERTTAPKIEPLYWRTASRMSAKLAFLLLEVHR